MGFAWSYCFPVPNKRCESHPTSSHPRRTETAFWATPMTSDFKVMSFCGTEWLEGKEQGRDWTTDTWRRSAGAQQGWDEGMGFMEERPEPLQLPRASQAGTA